MDEKLANFQWQNFKTQSSLKFQRYLKQQLARPYGKGLITKLRGVELAGVPASVLLLSHKFVNGKCHECAFLLSKAFFDTDEEIYYYTADIDSLRRQPGVGPEHAKHSFLEHVTRDGHHWIYDTTRMLIFDKDAYWQLEKPLVRHVCDKTDLIQRARNYECLLNLMHPNLKDEALTAVNHSLQFNERDEIYAAPCTQILQHEFQLYQNAQGASI